MLNILTNRRITPSQDGIDREVALKATPTALPGVEAHISADGTGHIRRDPSARSILERMRRTERLKRQGFFNLDAFGSIFWSQIDGKTTLSQIARSMATEFDWDLTATENSVIEFAKTLICRGLIDLQLKRRNRYSNFTYWR